MGAENLRSESNSMIYLIMDQKLYRQAREAGKNPLTDEEYKDKIREIKAEGSNSTELLDNLRANAGAGAFEIVGFRDS